MTEPEILETPVTEETPVTQPVVNPAEIPEKQENMFTGIIGALLGAALGGASIVLLGQLGYVASISGLILAVCTLKGYELLGKSRGTVGTILCVLLMLITPYIAYRISFAMQLVSIFAEQGESVVFADVFASVHVIVEMAGATFDFIKELAMLYLFTALGAFGTLKGLARKK